jgi:CRISPR-associated protein Cmr4
MNSQLFGLLAETSIHPGAGQSTGFVDLPVAREAATDYPVIVGSSIKGALKDLAGRGDQHRKEFSSKELRDIFGAAAANGQETSAGALLVSDARLLLLPVRSLKSQYKWVTCPHLIERLIRDRSRTGSPAAIDIPTCKDHHYLSPADTNDGQLFLEERQFSRDGDITTQLLDIIKPLIASQPARERLQRQLVIISDNDFVWFARYGLAVTAHNVLDKNTKASNNLWYEETIPPDSLFYLLLAERSIGTLDAVKQLLNDHRWLQVGGNETTGQGWFAVSTEQAGGAA